MAYDRTEACRLLAQIGSADTRSYWSWEAEGTWRYGNHDAPDPRPWWFAILKAGQSRYEWEFRSYQDSSLLGGGSSADFRTALRAVKAGPQDTAVNL